MSEKTFEEEAIATIQELGEEVRKAERDIQRAQEALAEKEQELSHWQGAMRSFRQRRGYPADEVDYRPVITDEYTTLGPTDMIRLWSKTHGGEVIMTELCERAVLSGAYKTKKQASSNLSAVIRKHKSFTWIAPGHYRQHMRSLEVGVTPSGNAPVLQLG